jgi:hypothetical protein
MKKITNAKIAWLAALLLAALLPVSCTTEVRINTQGAQDSEVTGTYSVIYYGCNFNNDLETIVLLAKEGGNYTFEPYAPDFKYRVKKGVAAKDAVAGAKEFVNCSTSFRSTQLYKITGPTGDILGYEVRPLYDPLRYGAEDVLFTDYELRGNKLVIKIRLNPSVEMMLQGGSGKDDGK